MQKFQLSAERVHLLKKVAKKERDPLEILVCTIFSSLLFLYIYLILAFKFRFEEVALAWILGPGVVLAICLFFSFQTFKKVRNSVPGDRRNLFVNITICSWLALIVGCFLADRSFWLYTTNVWSYRDLVSYVDVDPFSDSGQAFMDSGHLYFKESSYVLRQKFNKFRNGDTYCVAPIIRGSFTPLAGSKTMNGYVLPASGTYDWWAVGVNCCDGNTAKNFTCGEVRNPLARSGMRLLNDNQRPFYLLAVQEWSATYGLPVKHPLFFTWVKDPLETESRFVDTADNEMLAQVGYFALAVFLVSFLLHLVMHRNKIY